jgi:hypothetical protein
MLVLKRAIDDLDDEAKYQGFVRRLRRNMVFANLGSLGPDLPYYQNIAKTAIKTLLFKKSDKPVGIHNYAYPLHSCNPNVFALKLLELIWKESEYWNPEEWDSQDNSKFAFLCGYLSHVAADQIIHPVVNKIAKPYYQKIENSETHRECEIYQDISIFLDMEGRNPLHEEINKKLDIAPDSSTNAPTWFRYFIQKAFLEAFGIYVDEGIVEDWLDGTLLITRLLDNGGPYPAAFEEIENEKLRDQPRKTGEYRKYYKYYVEPDYQAYFDEAVELTKIYIRTVFESYDLDEFSDEQRDHFLNIVRNADLSAPLEKGILAQAQQEFDKRFAS